MDNKKTEMVRSEQVRAVYDILPFNLMMLVLTSSALVFVMWAAVDHKRLVDWYLLSIAMLLFRYLIAKRFKNAPPEKRNRAMWSSLATLGAWLSGIVWGLSVIMLWPQDNLLYQTFLIIFLVGMVSGGVSTLTPMLWASLGFALFSLTPLFWRFFIADQQTYTYMGYLLLLFIGVIFTSAIKMNHTVVDSLRTRFRWAESEARVKQQAFYDELTGLPNRRLLFDRLNREVARAKRHLYTGAVLFLDLDHFKTINDSLGHQIGDELLQQVAERLADRLRDEDTAARLGGDEFVILLSHLDGNQKQALLQVEAVAADLQQSLNAAYSVSGHELYVTSSMGVALFPENGDTPEDLLRHADTAMYEAKQQGRNLVRLFRPGMQEAAHRRLKVESELRIALQQNQLLMHYQPQVDSKGQIYGLEGLVRWNHPEKGLIFPGDFIHIAEDTGLGLDLHEWVLERVCQDIKRFTRTCGKKLRPVFSINLSPQVFRRPGFVDKLRSKMREHKIAAGHLCLEITEHMTMDNVEQVIQKMQAVKELGVTFSIDDFGTGYSSFAYLKRLPVDSLKIDQSFVRDILVDPNDAIIVETIISMATLLGIEPIAEGVEHESQLKYLKEKGCNRFQGWLLGEPGTLEAIIGRVIPGNYEIESA